MQTRDTEGFDVSVNYAAGEKINIFGYADVSEWDGMSHLRTKCSNCSAPDPLLAPWDIPGFDWFSEYTDTTTAFGFGLAWDSGEKDKLDITLNYTDGEIVQNTYNPVTPTELNPLNPLFGDVAQVALASAFPTQNNTQTDIRIQWTRKLNPHATVGFWYLYEDFELDDFQLDPIDAYGANYLDIEDTTRFLLLGSRVGDYTAHIAHVFLKMTL